MAISTTGNTVGLTSQEHRNQTAALLPPFKTALGVRGGTHSGLGIKKTSGMQFSIDPGRAVVEPESPSSGPYVVTVDAQERLSFDPGDSTRDRIDLVCVKVDESIGVEGPGSIVVVKGAYPASGAAVRPAIPKAHEALYAVPIPAGTSAGNGGWSVATAVDLRRSLVSLGSAIPVNSLSERNQLAPYEGMQVMRLDLSGTIDRYVRGKWRGNSDWTNLTFAPGWRKVTGAQDPKVRVIADGMMLQVWGEVYCTSSANPGEGTVIASIPTSLGVTPSNNSWILATDDNYRSTQVVILDAAGRILLGPAPNGRIFMFQGTIPLEAN